MVPWSAVDHRTEIHNHIMERFLSALVVIGVTLACHPVPHPKKHGLGNQTSQVTLITQAKYDANLVQHFMKYFPQLDIEERSEKLGKFTDLGSADVGGNFAYTFTLLNSDCDKVSQWLGDIKKSEQVIQSTSMKCTGNSSNGNGNGTTSGRSNTSL